MRVISVNSSEVKILEGVVDDRYQHLLNLRELHHARQADVQLKEKQVSVFSPFMTFLNTTTNYLERVCSSL